MNPFSVRKVSQADVDADRDAVWAALCDPDLVARLTPFVASIEVVGPHLWAWELHRVPIPGSFFNARFTERMDFTPKTRIEYAHTPPVGEHELAGVDGWYSLSERSDGRPGTHLEIALTVRADLPAPKIAGPVVRKAMEGVLTLMGERFSSALIGHLGQR